MIQSILCRLMTKIDCVQMNNVGCSKMVTNSKPGKQKGFTLIEIMIALAVVSIAILALGSAMNHNTAMVSEVEKRLMAQWVASNIAAQTRLDLKVNRVKTGSDTSREEMGWCDLANQKSH